MSKKNEIGGSIEEYDVGEQLGRGGFATVYSAKCRNTGQNVAIKKINKSEITAGGLISRVRQEVTIHSQLNHPSILKLYTFFEDQQFVYLVLELCTKGELLKHLTNLRRVLTEDEAREYLSQIVAGMLYLHSQSIMHRDLTLSNILLDNNGRIKIADFGLATQLRRPDDRHTTMCGTPNYISPEVVTRSSHGLESDVWSLGCMLFIMLVGHPPFDSKGVKESIFTKVVIGDYKVPSYVSTYACTLISECLQKNPKERIKLEAIPYHPFMTVGSKVDVSRLSDSGLYTMTTVATTHYTRTPLNAISESDLSSCEDSGSSHSRQIMKPSLDPLLRHPSSPPVRMKSSPRELLPPNAGIIDIWKRKFTPLPSLKSGGNFACPTPRLPPLIKRERDVSEERRRQQLSHDQRYSSSSDEQSSSVQYSFAHNKDEASHHHNRERKDSARSNSRSKGNDKSTVEQDRIGGTWNSSERPNSCISDRHNNDSYNHYSGQQSQALSTKSNERYNNHQSRSLERKGSSDDPRYRCASRSGERYEVISRSSEFPHSSSKDRTNQQHVSRSLDKKDSFRNQMNHESYSSRDKYREHYSDRTHSCCQSSQHKSWCEKRSQAPEKVDSVYGSGKYSETEKRSNLNPVSSHHNSCNDTCKRSVNSCSRGHSASDSKNEQQNNILSDIPPVVNTIPAVSDDVKPKKSDTLENAKQQPGTHKKLGAVNSQTLRQQTSPLSSRRLMKRRYRSKRCILNILSNGEVCIEHLCNKRNQEMVDEVCRITPDGLRIVIYQPNGGSGSVPGDAPPPLPDEGAQLLFSYETLPVKYWNKYKAAARFVKFVKSITTKITYYTEQAKCYLMENSPDPDFVAMFYHGTKMTKCGNNLVVKETTGTTHTVLLTSGHKVLPEILQPLCLHFKQAHDHCLYLERVLSEVTDKTKMECFPIFSGRRPASASPSVSPPGKPHSWSDKENISPTSMQSYRSPRNITGQLGSFECSVASFQAASNSAPHVRMPLAPHTSSNIQIKQSDVKRPVSRIYVQNIGWASQGSNGEVSVEYLDGTQVQVSSNSPKVIFSDASGKAATYSAKDTLPFVLQNKLSQMEAVLISLAQSPASSVTPQSSHVAGL
ncbi:serine/threonine-protein kinase PLK4 [Procambarus clarkii]|uniref:serine/threonine-protein kinase PLK4 n=1 Tax=Procambarus clarkii TaxID=6728 RepID=UPI001E677500|nr:serine/threonine-protein kinase PLK4-like [Procambarus clarkii]